LLGIPGSAGDSKPPGEDRRSARRGCLIWSVIQTLTLR
jgi:hypothetical protein